MQGWSRCWPARPGPGLALALAPERRAAYAALALAIALCVLTPACTAWPHAAPRSPATVQLPPTAGSGCWPSSVVVPLPLAARYPMLAWRAGWLALLLAPLVPAAWWGGWPWGPPQILALLAAFCLAGVRQPRPVLWWMWALTLIPWWLWLVRASRT